MLPTVDLTHELARIKYEKSEIAREARLRALRAEGQVSKLTAFRRMLVSLWQRPSRTELQTAQQFERTEA